MNRDYFTTPVQSDRTSPGYGHTTLRRAGEPWYVSLALWIVLFGSAVLTAVACGL